MISGSKNLCVPIMILGANSFFPKMSDTVFFDWTAEWGKS